MSHDVVSNKDYWDEFYKKDVLSVPSQFCAMVSTEAPKDRAIIEFGCGNGRDSLYFASQRFRVSATDLSHQAIESCQELADDLDLRGVTFQQGDLSQPHDINSIVETGRNLTKTGKVTGYSRFVMHSINDDQEAMFLSNVSGALKEGELFYLEFRSKEDADLNKIYGNHYRRFVDTDMFVKSMTDTYGFELLYRLTGQGMAKYKNEDPFVSRLIFEKQA